MRKLTARLTGMILPKATGKAAPVKGACWSGCGMSGVWRDRNSRPGDKVPCC